MELSLCKICRTRHALGHCPSSEKTITEKKGRVVPDPSKNDGVTVGQSSFAAMGTATVTEGKTGKASQSRRGEPSAKKKKAAVKKSKAKKVKAKKKTKARSSKVEPAVHNSSDAGSSPAAPTTPKKGRPFKDQADKSLTATKPWEAAGVSRASWYRSQKKGM